MEIWHHVGFNNLHNVDVDLARLGIKPKKVPLIAPGYLLIFEISELDPVWSEIESLTKLKSSLNIPYTLFTREEILDAEWSLVRIIFEQGYPQPESRHQWRKVVYDDQCIECGIGHRQIKPFRIKREPHLGKKDFMSLFWTMAIFSSQKVFDSLAQNNICGYERWNTYIHKTDVPSQAISQLYVPAISNPGIVAPDDAPPEVCAKCLTPKYSVHQRGYLRYWRDKLLQDTDIQQTYEWFGPSQYTGYREVLISRRFAQLIVREGWKGIVLQPLQLL